MVCKVFDCTNSSFNLFDLPIKTVSNPFKSIENDLKGIANDESVEAQLIPL